MPALEKISRAGIIPFMAEHRVIEIRLNPDELCGDACETFVHALAHAVGSLFSSVTPPTSHATWSQRANGLLRSRKLPLPTQFPSQVHLEQLTEILARADSQIHVITASLPPPLARAVEWLESHSKIPVTLGQTPPDQLPSDLPDVPKVTRPPQVIHEGCHVTTYILNGRPHWASPGEQKLHQRLESDPSLRGMFACNVRVNSVHGRTYLVDFLHRTLKLVVEVDGFGVHSTREAFASDRHRDYELLISGYHTLRIDHEEIIRDIESALAKIRHVCHFLGAAP